jgi:hypothetical protein
MPVLRDDKGVSMMKMTTTKLACGLIMTAAALIAMPDVTAQNTAVEEFTAFAINPNTSRPTGTTGPNRPSTASLTFTIERWSTDEELNSLMAIVKEQQDVRRMNDALLNALQGLPRVGRIRESNTLGWDLRFARQVKLGDGGRQLLIATDRPIPHWEAREQPRSFDYRFTVLDIRLDKENRGEGKLLADTKLVVDPRTNSLVLEHYDIQPVRLSEIRSRN